jgi:hypothetical protein
VNFVDSWHILITTTYNSFMGYSWPRANCNESGHFFTGWVMEEESRFTVPSLCMCKSMNPSRTHGEGEIGGTKKVRVSLKDY